VYVSRFPSAPYVDGYLQAGRITGPGETARDMISRVVGYLERADALFDPSDAETFAAELGEALDSKRVVFSTPVMTNAGRHAGRPLAACSVPPADLRGDLAAVKVIVDSYHEAGMGTGFCLDDLDDPVSVLRYLNDVAVAGAASGREERPVGNMAVLSASHPAAADFAACKDGADGDGEQWKFNISLTLTDEEMRAAGKPGRQADLLSAAAAAAWSCADPGLIFADRLNEGNPVPHLGRYVSTAPCAEVGLTPGETCQFGYVNLGAFHQPGSEVLVDLASLGETVRVLVRALDDALEASLPLYPHPRSAQVMTAKRKIGVGVCGLADLLLKARLPYDSPRARTLARDAIGYVNFASKLASASLAATRGPCPAVASGLSRYADPAYLSRFAGLGIRTVSDDDWHELASTVARTRMLRNCSTIALPPTGRSAPVIAASTGIEPLFLLTDPHQPGQIHPEARTILSRLHGHLIRHVAGNGRLPRSTDVPAPLRALLATATEIPPSAHLAMITAVQQVTDEAVAKTINLPAAASPDDILAIFWQAWERGCKGITVYRDGSRAIQPKAL
jgi:ribonucleoside-diphosphate reductase alpha chain